MSFEKIKALFEKSNIKFAYDHFETPQKLPYGVYRCPSTQNLGADGKVYYTLNNIFAEIYTKKKSPSIEKQFETVLDDAEIYYTKNETYIDNEKMYQISYEMRL